MRVVHDSLIPHRWRGPPLDATLIARPNKFLAICRFGRRVLEAHVPDRGRCLDLLVPGQPLVLVEVAPHPGMPPRRTRHTVLLARAHTSPALFPDAPTVRGVRHLAWLARRARRGLSAALVFCAQRGDVRAIAADESIDPVFARALRRARRARVVLRRIARAAHPRGVEL